MENGFSSPRSDAFPAGLRVLVVDDDPTWLKILEKMLRKCSYEVTTCGLATDALRLLREKKDGYDIVISDVNMPDMDGFKLLEHVGLEMDLPVIMMSVDGETSRVMKGVQHGACDYLLKPIRMKELKNIWQHVFRKKIHEIRDIESHDCFEGIQMMRNGSDPSDDGHFLSVDDLTSLRKRKDVDNKNEEKDYSDGSSTKKARVVWSVDLHQKFVKAVNHIGFDKVGPKKILDLMNVPWLTRENVASHLQKYRLYLSRLQKDRENDQTKPYGGMKHPDITPKDPPGSFGLHNSATLQNDVANGSYRFSSNNLIVSSIDPSSREDDLKSIVSEPTPEPKRPSGKLPDSKKIKTIQMGFNNSFASQESDVNFRAFDSTIPTKSTWNEVSAVQFNKEQKPSLQLENGFNKLPLPDPLHYIHVDQLPSIPSINSKQSSAERSINGPSISKPSFPEFGSNQASHLSPLNVSSSGSFPPNTECQMVNHQTMEPIYTSASTLITTQGLSNQSCNVADLESTPRNLTSGSGSALAAFDDDFRLFFQGDYSATNLGVQNVDFLDYNGEGLIDGVPFHLYDLLRFGSEYLYDPTEYALVDQSLLT
ncbi:hypothetical protein UlMin_040095 [Ulmus minor]